MVLSSPGRAKMSKTVFGFVVSVLLLTACAGTPVPTASATPPPQNSPEVATASLGTSAQAAWDIVANSPRFQESEVVVDLTQAKSITTTSGYLLLVPEPGAGFIRAMVVSGQVARLERWLLFPDQTYSVVNMLNGRRADFGNNAQYTNINTDPVVRNQFSALWASLEDQDTITNATTVSTLGVAPLSSATACVPCGPQQAAYDAAFIAWSTSATNSGVSLASGLGGCTISVTVRGVLGTVACVATATGIVTSVGDSVNAYKAYLAAKKALDDCISQNRSTLGCEAGIQILSLPDEVEAPRWQYAEYILVFKDKGGGPLAFEVSTTNGRNVVIPQRIGYLYSGQTITMKIRAYCPIDGRYVAHLLVSERASFQIPKAQPIDFGVNCTPAPGLQLSADQNPMDSGAGNNLTASLVPFNLTASQLQKYTNAGFYWNFTATSSGPISNFGTLTPNQLKATYTSSVANIDDLNVMVEIHSKTDPRIGTSIGFGVNAIRVTVSTQAGSAGAGETIHVIFGITGDGTHQGYTPSEKSKLGSFADDTANLDPNYWVYTAPTHVTTAANLNPSLTLIVTSKANPKVKRQVDIGFRPISVNGYFLNGSQFNSGASGTVTGGVTNDYTSNACVKFTFLSGKSGDDGDGTLIKIDCLHAKYTAPKRALGGFGAPYKQVTILANSTTDPKTPMFSIPVAVRPIYVSSSAAGFLGGGYQFQTGEGGILTGYVGYDGSPNGGCVTYTLESGNAGDDGDGTLQKENCTQYFYRAPKHLGTQTREIAILAKSITNPLAPPYRQIIRVLPIIIYGSAFGPTTGGYDFYSGEMGYITAGTLHDATNGQLMFRVSSGGGTVASGPFDAGAHVTYTAPTVPCGTGSVSSVWIEVTSTTDPTATPGMILVYVHSTPTC